MPIATDNGARMPKAPAAECCTISSPKTCTLQHSDLSAVSYAAPADGIAPQRVTPLAARLKISADTAATQDDAMPIPTDNGKGMPQASAAERRTAHAPQN